MQRMLYALAPLALSGVYFFGWRAAALLGVCLLSGMGVEYLMTRSRRQPVTTAGLVTCTLYALSLPVTTPFWVAIVGVVVAVLFGKEVFGGFGRNIANPAIVGRTFVYICFPVELTGSFVPAFKGFPGGLAHWSLRSLDRLPDYLAGAGRTVQDAVTQASPMWVNKALGPDVSARTFSWWDLATGSIGGTFESAGQVRILAAGSIGEGCALLIALAAAYLLLTRTAKWQLMAGCAAGLATATVVLRYGLGFDQWAPGSLDVPPLQFTLVAGTTMYAMVFMVTEPVSAPRKPAAMLIYSFLIGALVVLLRWRGVFVAAASFSILLGNITAPLINEAVSAWQRRRKRAAQPAGKEPAQ